MKYADDAPSLAVNADLTIPAVEVTISVYDTDEYLAVELTEAEVGALIGELQRAADEVFGVRS